MFNSELNKTTDQLYLVLYVQICEKLEAILVSSVHIDPALLFWTPNLIPAFRPRPGAMYFMIPAFTSQQRMTFQTEYTQEFFLKFLMAIVTIFLFINLSYVYYSINFFF